MHSDRTFPAAFFVPDGPSRAEPPQALHGRLSPRFISGGSQSSDNGVRNVQTDLADDPRGGAGRGGGSG